MSTCRRSLAAPEIDLASLYENGLPDFVELDGVARTWRNLGDGRFDVSRPMATAPAGLHLGDPGVQLLDADGDGRIDLVTTTGPFAGYLPVGAEVVGTSRTSSRTPSRRRSPSTTPTCA